MKNKYYYTYKISDNLFTIAEESGYITLITLGKIKLDYLYIETYLIKRTKEELVEYFNHSRKTFDIPIKLTGSDFQNRVWTEMINIPYGETITYKELAKLCNNPKAYQAIGQVCHKNKILIIIPCHRVVAKNGLGGFAFGENLKIKLLKLEQTLH